MRILHSLLRSLAVSIALWWGVGSSVCQAVTFAVTFDLTPLANILSPPAPYAIGIDWGEAPVQHFNTLTLSDIDFGPGGGPLDAPAVVGPPYSDGSLADMVTVLEGGIFAQTFTASATAPLRFLLDITTHPIPSGESGGEIQFGILSSPVNTGTLDTSLFILATLTDTLNIGAGPSFVQGPRPSPECPTCTGTIELSAPTLRVVTPEPETWVLMLSGMVGLLLVRRHART